MRHLIAVIALGLCACGSESTLTAEAASNVDARSSTSVTNSVNATNSSSVTSSTNVGSTSSSTSSTSGTGLTSCQMENDGKRCEVSCSSPQVAQCRKSVTASTPTCVCK